MRNPYTQELAMQQAAIKALQDETEDKDAEIARLTNQCFNEATDNKRLREALERIKPYLLHVRCEHDDRKQAIQTGDVVPCLRCWADAALRGGGE